MQPHLILLALATAAQAASIVPRDSGDSHPPLSYEWEIINWQAGESHGNPASPETGWYVFNISAPSSAEDGSYIAPFTANCRSSAKGFPLASDFADCTLLSGGTYGDAVGAVASRVYPVNGSAQCHMEISYTASGSDADWDVTAYVTQDWARERPPHNFSITVSN